MGHTAGPVGIGGPHDVLGSYQVPFLVLAVIAAAMLVGAMVGLKPANAYGENRRLCPITR